MKGNDPIFESLVEKGRNDPTVMEICYHEYVGDTGKLPPEGWVPSDKEVFAVMDRIGFDNLET
jgi:hypothetical protein